MNTPRDVVAADLDAALALLREAELPTEGVADHFEQGYAIIEQNDRIIALAGIERYGEDGLLRSVAVAAPYRGCGLGVSMVQDRLRWARERRIRDLYLLTTTAADFFERLGFARVERASAPVQMQQAPEFAYICGSTSTTMKLSLAENPHPTAQI